MDSGKIIEFDANVIVMDLHGKYKTRYDVLMLPGDYYPENAVGPYLKFEDVNMLNLNLTGDVPEYIGIGQNIRVRARVVKYNEIQGLLIDSYITSGDYKNALQTLDKIPNKNAELKKAEQLAAFLYGTSLFTEGSTFPFP